MRSSISAASIQIIYPRSMEVFTVVASCIDLIICEDRKSESRSRKCNYYFCNPFTMQRAALPPQPRPHVGWHSVRTGLVCKPYDGCDRFRYRIVRFYSKFDLIRREVLYHAVIYCSETIQINSGRCFGGFLGGYGLFFIF